MTVPPDFLLLSGPPFGPTLWEGVRARLGSGKATSILDFGAGGPTSRGRALASDAPPGAVIVAHGSAVPAVVVAASASPASLRGVVLVNGPVTRVDPVSRALAAILSAPGGTSLLRPRPWLRWLASSAGLRRAVVNPYVMDRDTVAAVCGPVVGSGEGRAAAAAYLRALSEPLPDPRSIAVPTLAAWGDDDALYPASEADFLESSVADCRHVRVPGGKHLHPIERPWALADAVAAWAAALPPGRGP
jgi:pimeloyl-ACP methyl ester carboxylesterase